MEAKTVKIAKNFKKRKSKDTYDIRVYSITVCLFTHYTFIANTK